MRTIGKILAALLLASARPAYAGGVVDGQPVNAAIVNAAYLYKNANDASLYQYLFGATGSPAASSQLELRSTTKGFLPPRMTTTQRDAIASPATGLACFNTTTLNPNFYSGSAWVQVTGQSGSLTSGRIPFAGTDAYLTDSANLNWDATNGRLGIGTTAPAYPLDVRQIASGIAARLNNTADDVFLDFTSTGEWKLGTSSRTAFRLIDSTNGKTPFTVAANSTGVLAIGSAGVAVTGTFQTSGVNTLTGLTTAGPVITTSGGVLSSEAALAEVRGGTAQTTYATGDMLYASGANTLAKRTVGSSGNVLTVSGGVPTWAPPATAGTVTSVAMTVPTFLSVSGSPVTSSGTLAVSLSGTALPIANGGTSGTTKSTAFDALSPMTTIGDIIYGGTSGTGTRLAGNSTNTRKFLEMTGSGSAAVAPTWKQPDFSDLSGTVSKAQGGTGADNSSVTFPSSGTIDTAEATTTFTGQKSFSLAPLPTTNYSIGSGVDIGSASFVWKDLYLGNQFIYAGTQPASVGTATGTAAAAFWSLTGAVGGNTTIVTTGTGGVGQALSTTAGVGGQATAATTSATGGAGGANTQVGGTGGATTVSSATVSVGGAGGASSKTGGTGGASSSTSGTNQGGGGGTSQVSGGGGGAASGATSGLNTGGTGGLGRTLGGSGGNASAGTGSLAGGVGGGATLQSGAGGTATGTGTGNNTGGASGAVLIQGSAGGAATGAITGNNTGGTAPDIQINAGGGGAASGASGTNTGGNGANIQLTGGVGGTGTSANGTSGYIKFVTGASSTERHRIQADGTQLLGAVTASTVPTNTTSQMGFYQTGTKFVLWYNDASTVRYKYLDMSGTGVTWVATTSAP